MKFFDRLRRERPSDQGQDDVAKVGDGGFRTELERVAARRQALVESGNWQPPSAGSVGLALSGGGIRSATFCLGALFAFNKLRLLPNFDYVSSVSGGGYAGSFFGSLFARRGKDGGAAIDPLEPLSSEQATVGLRHLRDSGRYLLPGGSGDALRLFGIAVRNWFGIHLTIGLLFLTLCLALKPLQVFLADHPFIRSFQVGLVDSGASTWLWPVQWLQGMPMGMLLASPLWLLTVPLALFSIAAATAYWLGQADILGSKPRWFIPSPPALGAILILLVSLYGVLGPTTIRTVDLADGTINAMPRCALGDEPGLGWITSHIVCAARAGSLDTRGLWAMTAIISGTALLMYTYLRLREHFTNPNPQPDNPMAQRKEQKDRIRSRLTSYMAKSLLWLIAIAGLAILDTLSQTLYVALVRADIGAPQLAGGGLTLAALIQAARALIRRFSDGKFREIVRRFGHWIALVAALLLAGGVLLLWALLAHLIAWRGGPIASFEAWFSGGATLQLLSITLFVAALTFLTGVSYSLLNESSFYGFYSSRLRRAYLGASNFDRVSADNPIPVDLDHKGDDLSLSEYYRPDTKAPVHLINVTVNKTASRTGPGVAGSGIVQRDRHGFPLVVSPGGFLYSQCASNAEASLIPFTKDNQLTLSSWVAISGAAVSTGMGQRTSLGLSLLAGIANLRLGYWWEPRNDDGRVPRGIRLLLNPIEWWRNSVQNFLRKEFIGRFHGADDPRWYLTDGGHFENTGIYELIRRKVRFIVACDNGADPDFVFDDVVNLVRKARIDFGAEITFLGDRELDHLLGKRAKVRSAFGDLDALSKPWSTEAPGPYAAIARITYHGTDNGADAAGPGTLILIKPRVSGLEATDIVRYQKHAPKFPQQTTADQFFDEAQWESYFFLGRYIVERIFRKPTGGPGARWHPSSFAVAPDAPASLAPAAPASVS